MDPLNAAAVPETDNALQGVRVIDVSNFLPGPLCTLHLVRMGADVVKVEPPDGDPMREIGPRRDGRAVLFDELNAGKRCLTLDIKQHAGLAALLALTDDADVLVEGFRPGVLDRLGCGWSVVSARNPRLVMCSITGYGQRGLNAQRAGHDINYLTESGVLDQMRADGKPALANLQIADVLGGAMTALPRILAGLIAAQRTGIGRHIDISMTDAMREYHLLPRAQESATGSPPPPGQDLLTGGAACYKLYEAQDGGWIAVGALEHKFWSEFCKAIGRADLASRHWSLGEQPGTGAAHATIAEVQAAIGARPGDYWSRLFLLHDCCVSLIPAKRGLCASPPL